MNYVLLGVGLLGVGLVCVYLIYLNYTKNNQIKKLRSEKKTLRDLKDSLKDENHSLKLEKNELEHSKIKLNGKIKEITLDNNYLKYQLVEVSKLIQKIMKIKPSTDGKFDDGFNPASLFADDKQPKEKGEKKSSYNVEDILIEIGQKGISNISKDKLDFLNKNNK